MATDWDQSYPPSLWAAPPAVVPTGATAGTPGAWTPAGSTAPGTLAQANALGLSLGAAWATGQWVDLAGGGDIHWAGAAFALGQAPVVEVAEEATPKRRRKAEEE